MTNPERKTTMNLRNPWNARSKRLLVGGMAALAIGNAWPRFIHLSFGLSPDVIDLTHGFFLGLAIGLMLMAVIVNNRSPRCQE
jgi:hypothetical protein